MVTVEAEFCCEAEGLGQKVPGAEKTGERAAWEKLLPTSCSPQLLHEKSKGDLGIGISHFNKLQGDSSIADMGIWGSQNILSL